MPTVSRFGRAWPTHVNVRGSREHGFLPNVSRFGRAWPTHVTCVALENLDFLLNVPHFRPPLGHLEPPAGHSCGTGNASRVILGRHFLEIVSLDHTDHSHLVGQNMDLMHAVQSDSDVGQNGQTFLLSP